MKNERLKEKKAVSPVISALILSVVVLVVGGGVWFYSQGAMTITSEYYAESVINSSETISERFIIEHVYYEEITEPATTTLHVFVYNYGTVDIEVKVEINEDDIYPIEEKVWIKIPSKEMMPIPIPFTLESEEKELNIRAYTRRENTVYYRYLVS